MKTSSSWTLWPVPDPDVFGDHLYSWKFFLAVNLPVVLGFWLLLTLTPLAGWADIDPVALAYGGTIQLASFVGVVLLGKRLHPSVRELVTFVGTVLAAVSVPAAASRPIVLFWALYLLIVFFDAYGNPKSLASLLVTVAAPFAALLGHFDPATAREKMLLTVMVAPIGIAVYLLVAYVAEWTRRGALDKAARARESGAREERARIESGLGATLGTALSEIALWHEVALASDVEGARAESLAKARARAREAITELRTLAAGVDHQPAKMAGLAGEIQRRAGNLCAAAGIGFDLRIGALGTLSLSDAYHAAMVAIEAVENAIAHGRPTRVTVTLSGAPLGVTVEDDGAGFDPATAPRGRGMRNLETLANALGAPLEIETAPGKGTRVRVAVAA